MRTNDIFPSKWLTAADLNDQTITLTIRDATLEALDDESKLVLYFRELAKGMVVNKTNCRAITEALGSDETDDWIGFKVVLFPTMVDFQGKQVEAIRVNLKQTKQLARSAPPRRPIKPMTQQEADDEGDEIDDPPY